jgi:hypothetical protein
LLIARVEVGGGSGGGRAELRSRLPSDAQQADDGSVQTDPSGSQPANPSVLWHSSCAVWSLAHHTTDDMLRLSWIGGTASRAQAFDEALDEAEI